MRRARRKGRGVSVAGEQGRGICPLTIWVCGDRRHYGLALTLEKFFQNLMRAHFGTAGINVICSSRLSKRGLTSLAQPSGARKEES